MNYVEHLAARIREELPDDADPPEDADSLFLLYALLALTKGERVTRQDVHDAWSTWMTTRGHARHKSLQPFDELDGKTRELDEPYVTAIRRAARSV